MRRTPIAKTVLAALLLAAATPALAQDAKVEIAGGVADTSGQNYAWRVTNHYSSPIVFIEFPHFRADTFIAPTKDWSQEWKNRAMLGGKDEPGWCRTSARTPNAGVQPGAALVFRMRLSRAGATARPGAVKVRFADNTEVIVPGVEVPTAKTMLERNAMGIGLALVFAIGLWVHSRKRRKAAAAAAQTTDDG